MTGDIQQASPARIVDGLGGHGSSFWTGGAEGLLLVPHCGACERWVLPLASDCPDCDGELAPRPVSGLGTVFTYTIDFHPFNPAVPVPYVIAIIELDDQPGLRLVSNVVDCSADTVDVGMPVKVRFERQVLADGTVYVPVFAPPGTRATQGH